jgi:nitric oxide reductase large subunit
VYRDQPPLPTQVVASDKVLFTRDDVLDGMHVFQRYGLMEYGSVYGHGAYLGPDFTAEYLHKTAELLVIWFPVSSYPYFCYAAPSLNSPAEEHSDAQSNATDYRKR